MYTENQRPAAWLLVLTGIICTLVVVVFARLAYGLVLPAMREDLGLSYAQAANLGTVTALGYLSLVMLAGVFAGRFGGRLAILLGLVMGALGFLGLSLASNYYVLLALMVLLGFATAFAYTPLISLLGAWYPEKRGTIIGLANSGVGLGMLLTGSLVPWITHRDPANGWRLVWIIFAVAALAAALLVYLVLRDPPDQDRASSQKKGSTTPRSVYRNSHVITIGLIYGVVGITYIVQSIFMYSFALDVGISAASAGRLVALMGLISIFAGPGWGWAADRIGHANALMICMSLSLMGTLLPVFWPVTTAFALHYVLLGFSITGLFTSILAASTSTVQAAQAPVAVSFVTLFFALGQLLGPAIAGLLIEWQDGFRLVFALSAGLMIFGIILSLISARTRQKNMFF
jgi:MFS family permease